MASRMEKYYKTRESNKRIVRNESLYQTIYEDETYSNIEGVVATPKANEINIEKIKELIASREVEKKQNRKLERRELPEEITEEELEEEKSYDIRDVLVKAKDSRESNENEYRSLKNTEYNILKNIKVNNKQDLEQEELKELINTITSTSLLNKMSDNELSLNMFEDLTSNTMIGDSSSIKAILEETKEQNLHNTSEMDTSFFSSSLGFKDKDFEQLQNLSNSVNKNNKNLKIIFIILFIVIAVLLGLVVYNIIIK